jgi:hypothetical protein
MTAFGPYPKRSAVRLKSPSNLRPDALRIAPMVRPGPYMLEVVLFVSVTMENETLEGSWLSRGPRLASAVAVDACESCRRWAINTSVDHAGDSRPNERVREQDSARVHLSNDLHSAEQAVLGAPVAVSTLCAPRRSGLLSRCGT